MREPAFWHAPSSWLSRLLMPLAAIYGEIAGSRMKTPGVDVGIPVLCVGNFHVGGAGKTPTTLALVDLLREIGETPAVLSRGYGGNLRGPVKVNPETHTATEVGDEPLMMSRQVPTVVSRDRVNGAVLARSTGASVIVMDDGFQNPAINKDTSFIVIDSERGIGNGRVVPAGPLRAPLDLQLPRSDALVVIGKGNAADRIVAAVTAQGGAILHARLAPNKDSVAALRGKRVLAFAGIGDPRRFLRTLQAAGIDVAAEKIFADHHSYTSDDVETLVAQASRDRLTLVTTEKDLVKLAAFPSASNVLPFAVTLTFDEPATLKTYVLTRLNMARTKNMRSMRPIHLD